MRVIIKQLQGGDTKGKPREAFEGRLAEFFPMYMSQSFDSWRSGTVFMLEGPLAHSNTGYHFDYIIVEPVALDNALGESDDFSRRRNKKI